MNKFTGTLTYSDKTPAPNAKVKLTVSGSSSINESTTTDNDGNWSISLKEDVNPKDVTILFSKSGYKSKQVTNPEPTEFFEELIDPKTGGSLKLQSLFGSGKWKVESLSGEDKDVLDHELEDLFQFIKSTTPQNVQIKIRSSESQVPNADRENTGKDFREPGSLAKARGESLKKYIEEEINKKINNDTGIQNKENYRPIFNYTEDDITRVGDKLWERGNPQVQAENDLLKQQEGVSNSADLSKYKKDQYVAVDVTLINTQKDCAAANLFLFVMYLTQDLGGKGGHNCNSALYQLYANDELLYRNDGKDYASLNNNIDIDAGNPNDPGSAPKKYNNRQEEKYNKDLKKYDNLVTRINRKNYGLSKKLPSLVALERGDTFLPSAREYIEPPIVTSQRYNTFFLDSNTLKRLTAGKPDNEKIIRFGITCYNPTNWESPENWGYGCHKGAGSFKLIKVEEDKKNKRLFTVSVATDIYNGVTPRFPSSEPTWLLDYNLCETDPKKAITFNPDLLKEAESSNEGDTEG
jgi:hypothetical protein